MSVAVDVSYDDGATWQSAAVTGSGSDRTVTVHHPANARFALRASAVDDQGNAVTQSIIRAYGLHK